MKVCLGIDYGSKRVGLAMASTPIAEPYKIISKDMAIETIGQVCKKENITDIVIGISEGNTKKLTLNFVDELKQVIHLPIHRQDETLSSYEIKQHFLESGVKKSKLHGSIDHYSAAMILQDYLDENNVFND